jgi:hypothetical protein
MVPPPPKPIIQLRKEQQAMQRARGLSLDSTLAASPAVAEPSARTVMTSVGGGAADDSFVESFVVTVPITRAGAPSSSSSSTTVAKPAATPQPIGRSSPESILGFDLAEEVAALAALAADSSRAPKPLRVTAPETLPGGSTSPALVSDTGTCLGQ